MLDVRGLDKRFGGLHAVRKVSLHAAEGHVTALIGPNGAGKTTTFAAMAGFVRPDAGRVLLDGTDVTRWPPPRIAALGMVRTFQVTQPFAGLTVAENIRVGAFLRTRSRTAAMAEAREVGARLGLGPLLDRPASALTVAGRKRLEVARALATRPRLLLLDEVMAGLNPTEVDGIVDLVRAVVASGVTVLMIEHLMRAVSALAHHVVVLAEGAVIASGPPAAIAANPAVVEAYLGHGASRVLAGTPTSA